MAPRPAGPKGHSKLLCPWLFALVFSAWMMAGCGRKAPPVAPHQLPPPAVVDLTGQLQADRIFLTWSLPPDARHQAPELAGFNLYRARTVLSETPCGDCPKVFERSARIDFAPADTSAAGTMRWRYEAPMENGFHHIFKLRTVLADGREGPDSNLVELDH